MKWHTAIPAFLLFGVLYWLALDTYRELPSVRISIFDISGLLVGLSAMLLAIAGWEVIKAWRA